MGLIDDIVGSLSGAQASQRPMLSQAIQGLMGNADGVDGQPGPGLGIHGLVQRLEEAGLGELVQSWIGTGPNLPITPEQLHGALGQQQTERMAQQAQMIPDEFVGELAQHLPGVIDRMTPNGRLEQATV